MFLYANIYTPDAFTIKQHQQELFKKQRTIELGSKKRNVAQNVLEANEQ